MHTPNLIGAARAPPTRGGRTPNGLRGSPEALARDSRT